jgi:photosystem II stability/assembly factor-like uncharacterized protein
MNRRPLRILIGLIALLLAAGVVSVAVFAARSGPAPAWQRIGLPGITVHSLTFGSGRSAPLFAATESGIYKRTTGGSWRRILKDGSDWSVDVLDGNRTILTGDENGDVDISRDGGRTWQRRFLSGTGVYAVTTQPGSSALMLAGAGGGLYRSTDGGRHWQRTMRLPSSAGTAFAWPSGAATVYAGVVAGGDDGATQVYASSDGGVHWHQVGNTFASHGGIMSLAAPSGSAVYAGTMGNAIWRVDSLAGTWRKIALGIPPHQHVAGIAVAPRHARHMAIGTLAAGVLSSESAGKRWQSISSGLPATDGDRIILDVTFDPSGHALYAATEDGVYTHSLNRPQT